MKLLLFSFFLKREEEEDKEEEEETLEMIALPLCLLRFVRVRALAVVALGGIDDDDNIFYLNSVLFLCHLLACRKERFFFEEHSIET